MKILGVACSPRPKSNSTILLNSAMEFLNEKGHTTEIIHLRKLNFRICIGCEACTKSGNCIFNDDITQLFGKIEQADWIIISAPVYSMNINALAKGMIDRVQMYWARKYVIYNEPENKELRKGMFISTAGLDLQGVHDCSRKTIRYFYRMLDTKYEKELLVTKVDAPGEILTRPEVFVQLKEILNDII